MGHTMVCQNYMILDFLAGSASLSKSSHVPAPLSASRTRLIFFCHSYLALILQTAFTTTIGLYI